jgi:hypothetical protein
LAVASLVVSWAQGLMSQIDVRAQKKKGRDPDSALP